MTSQADNAGRGYLAQGNERFVAQGEVAREDDQVIVTDDEQAGSGDEPAGGWLAGRRLPEDELAERGLPEDELAGRRLPEDELAERRLPEDELAERGLAEDGPAGGGLSEDGLSGGELPGDELLDDGELMDGDQIVATNHQPRAAGLPTLVPARGSAAADEPSRGVRWHEIQAMFVDDPQTSVQLAASLVDDSTEAFVASLRQRQQAMQSAWQGADADTEGLRTALQEYRALWDQLEDFSG